MKSHIFKKILRVFIVASTVFSATESTAVEKENLTRLEDQTSVAVTIYNENLALIKDVRNIQLDNGINQLAFRDVSAQIRPETALLRSLTGNNNFRIIEQNFDYDLLTPQKLLEKYVGKKIQVATLNPVTGIEKIEDAVVLSTNQGVVLKINDRIETNVSGRFIYNDVPENLRDRPTLIIQLDNPGNKSREVELSYLTGGLSWKADYVAELNASDDKIDMLGWVTLNNNSGASYRNARLQLVAGDVNQVKREFRDAAKMALSNFAAEAPATDMMSEESLFEYHLYNLNRPTTISENQSKQVSLLTAASVPVNKQFLLQGNEYYYRSSYGDIGQKMKVGVFVEFANEEKSGLGIPLPKGIVRVYKKDKAGNAQFIGEDNIDHTPKKEEVRLKLGDAFDITANKKQTDFKKRTAFGKYSYAFESAYQIELKNAKSEAITVVVREPIPGDWEMLEETHKFKKVAAGTAEWQIEIPPEDKTILEYRVLVRY